MRLLRSIALLLFTIALVTLTVLGQVKPTHIDTESLLRQYYNVLASANQKEEVDKWLSNKSQVELASITIVVGCGLLNQLPGNVLTDSIHYKAYNSAVAIIEKGVVAAEESGDVNALYLTTNEAGLVPARYILANAYDKVFMYAKADSAYIRTANEIGRDFGVDSEEFVFWTNQCAESLQRKNKNYDRAINLLLPAKEAALHSPEVSDSTACAYLISLAQKYQRCGNHNEAKVLAHEAEKRMGSSHESIFEVCNILGEIYCIEGKHETSNEYFRKAESNAPSLLEFFAVGVNYANVMRETGYYDNAESILLELGKYLDSKELTDDIVFHYYESLGVLYTFTDPTKSSECFQKAAKLIDKVSYPEVVRHILNSQVYPNEGNSFKTISAIDRAEYTFNLFVGNEPRLHNELIMLKGHYLLDISDYKKAREYFELAYMRMLDYAPGDPHRINVFRQLARLDEIEGEQERRGYYLDVLLREAKLHGESSEIYLGAVGEMLHYCLQTKEEEGAEYFYDIYKKHRPESFDTHCYNYRIYMLKGKTGEAEKALDSIKMAFPDYRAIVNRMYQRFYVGQQSPKITEVADTVFAEFKEELLRRLLFMSNNERRNVDMELRSMRDEIISAMRFAPGLTELALNYSLFSKGLMFHTQNEIRGLLAGCDSAQMEMAKIRGLKAELSKAINSSDKNMIYSLQRAIDSRERYLIDDYLDYKRFINRFERYNSKKLSDTLTPSDVMIDFVEYVDSGKTCLGAFIIEQGHSIKFINLGEKLDIDRKMYRQIWSDVLAQIPSGKRIYFSTDGILNTLPIEFVEDDDGVPVSHKYDFHRVFHLADIQTHGGIGDNVVAIGVSDHNSPIGNGETIDRGSMTDLPDVAYEMQLIRQRLNPDRLTLLFNDDATESEFKRLDGTNMSSLHISTHGVFRDYESLCKSATNPNDDDYHIALRMLQADKESLSGLILRQGNLSWKSGMVFDDNDDILTAEEIEAMSFPNLRLTVLSACESGLGDIDSDGVWGLQRAFRIAGSKSLICSLRKIPDYETALFMDAFYEKAGAGETIYDSFHHAQKALYDAYPDNPEIWSSFILIE